VLAGIEAAHALANSLTGAPASEVFASAATGRGALEPLGLLFMAAIVAGVVQRIRSGSPEPRRAAIVAAPFALLPPVGFALLELAEALASGQAPLDRPFVVGFALQLPVALLGYLLARGLLRLGDELRTLVLSPPPLALPECGCAVLPAFERPLARSGAGSPRGRGPPFGVGH
jgi:hypothetical protein